MSSRACKATKTLVNPQKPPHAGDQNVRHFDIAVIWWHSVSVSPF